MRAAGMSSDPPQMVVCTMESAQEKCQVSNRLLSAISVHHYYFRIQVEHHSYKEGRPKALTTASFSNFQIC